MLIAVFRFSTRLITAAHLRDDYVGEIDVEVSHDPEEKLEKSAPFGDR